MNKIFLLFIFITSLSACTADTERAMLLTDGTVRIEPSEDPRSDYRFTILNGFNMTYDFADKPDRIRAATDYLKDDCKTIEEVQETSITVGKYGSGNPRKIYTLDVKCL